jgi:hypothetical protein
MIDTGAIVLSGLFMIFVSLRAFRFERTGLGAKLLVPRGRTDANKVVRPPATRTRR